MLLNRGEVEVSTSEVLTTHISTCVSVCLYHPRFGIGGMTHISRSREDDTTPSGKHIRQDGYFYADRAVPRLVYLLKKRFHAIRGTSLRMIVAGGERNEGPIKETLKLLKSYKFQLTGMDINREWHRHVDFNTSSGIVKIEKRNPLTHQMSTRWFSLTQNAPNLFETHDTISETKS